MPTYRVYYNRANEAPQVWSVDEGDQTTELNVIAVRCMVPCETVVGESVPDSERSNRPAVWLRAEGVLRVERGVAYIDWPARQFHQGN